MQITSRVGINIKVIICQVEFVFTLTREIATKVSTLTAISRFSSVPTHKFSIRAKSEKLDNIQGLNVQSEILRITMRKTII